MPLIEVDIDALRTLADQADEFCKELDTDMKSAVTAVQNGIPNAWQGADATEFLKQWNEVYSKDSVAVKFRDSIKNYGECLRECAKEYEEAQKKVYNQARNLPRY